MAETSTTCQSRQLTERPAIQYMKIIDELAELRKGTPLVELESWAWDMLMDILPENMITVAASLGIVDKPTREQLKKFTYMAYKDRVDVKGSGKRFTNAIIDDSDDEISIDETVQILKA